MAFSESLAARVRSVLAETPGVTERRMFGGLAFLIDGHMACGVLADDLMLRLGEEGADAALDEDNVRPMDFTGRPMGTMVFVAPAGVATDAALAHWVGLARQYVKALPPKKPKTL